MRKYDILQDNNMNRAYVIYKDLNPVIENISPTSWSMFVETETIEDAKLIAKAMNQFENAGT